MREMVRTRPQLALVALALTLAPAAANAQTAPAAKGAQSPKAQAPIPASSPSPAPLPAQPSPPSAIPKGDPKQVLGTVNGESITRGELINLLSRYQIPVGSEEQVYDDAMNTLINTHLVNQFLARQNIAVPEAKVDEAMASLDKELKESGTDLATQLKQTGMTIADVRKEYASRLRWIEYLNKKATDAELKSFAESHKALLNGTQVRASHIVLRVDPDASASDKEKVRQKLLGIKRDIESNKISFAEAANKHSEDPSNAVEAGGAGQRGGDIGYFSLNSGIIEEFAKAAFDLKKGVISDPVETPYGLHLILVTDRKEGGPFDAEQNKPLVKQIYAAELQKNLLAAERKKAEDANKIDIQPMPKDLFPAPAPMPAAAPATKTEAKKK